MPAFHTQAGNFLDFVKTGVDPRTGQFTLAISLPLPPANQLCGPALNTALSFSTLGSMADHGFGLGWSLGLSRLDLGADHPNLVLGSGDRFAIDLDASGSADALVLPDLKLKAFSVTRQNDDSYRIDKPNGECEIVRPSYPGSACYVLSEVHSPEGRRLFIDWMHGGEDGPRLHKIRDEQRTLLEARFDEGQADLVMNPGTPDAATLRCALNNQCLSALYVPGIEAPFQIDYERSPLPTGGQWLLPCEFSSPLGAREIVHWATHDDAHQLPPGGFADSLPRVASWTHTSGTPASELNRHYRWIGEHNFLGYGSDQAFEWQSGRDNLYQVESDYHYEMIETLADGNGALLGSVHRTWNRFHLLTCETTCSGPCEIRKQTLYGIDPTLAWAEQPPACQLPHTTLTTYRDTTVPGEGRSEKTLYTYDFYGNVLSTLTPDGIEERCEYYSAEGEAGCPADALGRVRHLKRKTVIPSASAPGNAPRLSTLYRYKALPSLISGAPCATVLASEERTDLASGQALEHTQLRYIEAPGPTYGKLQESTTTLNAKATRTQYRYEIKDQKLLTDTTLTGFEQDEQNTTTSRHAQLLHTGLTAWEQSSSGARTNYEYDVLGRIVRTTVAHGSPYQIEHRAHYHIADAHALATRATSAINPVMIELSEPSGRRKRLWLDGDGRTVAEQQEDIDNTPGQFRDTASYRFDAQGRESQRTAFDWPGSGQQVLQLTTTTDYDGWGRACRVIGPDRVEQHTRYDPVGLRTEQWQQADRLKGPRRTLTSNPAGQVIEQQDHDSDGNLVRRLEQLHDGLGQVIERRQHLSGAEPIITTSRFDAFGREVERALADGTLVSWKFADHSDAHHPISVSVQAAPSEQTP